MMRDGPGQQLVSPFLLLTRGFVALSRLHVEHPGKAGHRHDRRESGGPGGQFWQLDRLAAVVWLFYFFIFLAGLEIVETSGAAGLPSLEGQNKVHKDSKNSYPYLLPVISFSSRLRLGWVSNLGDGAFFLRST